MVCLDVCSLLSKQHMEQEPCCIRIYRLWQEVRSWPITCLRCGHVTWELLQCSGLHHFLFAQVQNFPGRKWFHGQSQAWEWVTWLGKWCNAVGDITTCANMCRLFDLKCNSGFPKCCVNHAGHRSCRAYPRLRNFAISWLPNIETAELSMEILCIRWLLTRKWRDFTWNFKCQCC